MNTQELIQLSSRYLQGKHVESPRLAAERLLAHVLGCSRMDLYLDPERPIQEGEIASYRELVKGCSHGAPLQYLVGETEFMGLGFRTDSRALIPRPETEILVDRVVAELKKRAPRPQTVLELGVGSGAIAVSLARLADNVEVWGTDCDVGAILLAQENVRRHGVESRVRLFAMDRFEAFSSDLHGAFDWIVSNPPYVNSDEMQELPHVVRGHEPLAALHGGADGLDFYRYLASCGLAFLAPDGRVALEIGARQGRDVVGLLAEAGLPAPTLLVDYAKLDRVVLGRR